MFAHVLFTWIQGAQFYKDLHEQAVRAVDISPNCEWLDVGCGPGLVSRLAAQRGCRVVGIDSDTRMIAAAKRLARHRSPQIEFRISSVFDLAANSADVVSAASLLAVLDDKSRGLQYLWNAVRPGGSLLLIEPTAKMNLDNAQQVLAKGIAPKRSSGLLLWARARTDRAVPDSLFMHLDALSVVRHELLDGLVAAWVFRKHA